MGGHGWRGDGADQIGNPFPDSLTIPQKLDAQVAVFDPANDGNFYAQRGGFLRDRNLQGQIGSGIQLDVAAQPAAGRREVQ